MRRCRRTFWLDNKDDRHGRSSIIESVIVTKKITIILGELSKLWNGGPPKSSLYNPHGNIAYQALNLLAFDNGLYLLSTVYNGLFLIIQYRKFVIVELGLFVISSPVSYFCVSLLKFQCSV